MQWSVRLSADCLTKPTTNKLAGVEEDGDTVGPKVLNFHLQTSPPATAINQELKGQEPRTMRYCPDFSSAEFVVVSGAGVAVCVNLKLGIA